jgi:hypothetical protein
MKNAAQDKELKNAAQDKELKNGVQCPLNERPEPRQNSAQYTQKHVLAKEKFLKFEQFLK